MTDDPRERWVDKVKKLLAKAESTTPEEAEALLAKAGELIARWQIEEAELTVGRPDAWVNGRVVVLGTYAPTADVQAISLVVRPLNVRVAYRQYAAPSQTYSGESVPPAAYLYGFEADVMRAEMLWTVVQAQLVRAMKADEARLAFSTRGARRRWRMSFKLGYAHRVHERLVEAHRAVSVEAASAPGAALVLARHDEVERRFAEATGRGRASRLDLDPRGTRAGHAAGGCADLGQDRLTDHKSKELNP